jgi:hypothetical protein
MVSLMLYQAVSGFVTAVHPEADSPLLTDPDEGEGARGSQPSWRGPDSSEMRRCGKSEIRRSGTDPQGVGPLRLLDPDP